MPTKPLEDVRQISALTYGFIASKALFAALDLDLFTRIAQGINTLPALAKATNVTANRLRTLLTALKTVGLLSEAEGRFTNAPAATNFLVDGAAGDFRDYIRVVNGGFLYDGLRHLEKAMRGEPIAPGKSFYDIAYSEGGVGGSAFSRAQHAGSLGPAYLMARRVDAKWARTLLDVGGGSGAYTLAFLKANPDLKATILDFPATTETARRYVAEAGMTDRVSHVQGNAITTPWPAGQDIVLMSYVWSAVGGNDIPILARRAYDALKPGGLLLIHDFMVDDSHDGPAFAAWYLLASMLDNPDAQSLTPGYVDSCLGAAGFEIEGTQPMLAEITQLTSARRPQ